MNGKIDGAVQSVTAKQAVRRARCGACGRIVAFPAEAQGGLGAICPWCSTVIETPAWPDEA